jgi:hypothetical protein
MLLAAGEAHNVALVADNQHFWDAGAGFGVRTAFPIEQGDTAFTKQTFLAGSDPYADLDYGMLKPVIRTDCVRRLALAYRETPDCPRTSCISRISSRRAKPAS